MITRIWHGTTSLENAPAYLEFLLREGTAEYLQTPGIISVKVWKNIASGICHFWTVTEWTNSDAVRSFAGEDFEKAKYYPFDHGMLLEFEEQVAHYESYSIK